MDEHLLGVPNVRSKRQSKRDTLWMLSLIIVLLSGFQVCILGMMENTCKSWTMFINSCAIETIKVILQVCVLNSFYELMFWGLPVGLAIGECQTPHWWWVNGPGNGLGPSGNNPLPGPMLTQDLCYRISPLGYTDFPRYWPFVRGIPHTKASDAELRSAPE